MADEAGTMTLYASRFNVARVVVQSKGFVGSALTSYPTLCITSNGTCVRARELTFESFKCISFVMYIISLTNQKAGRQG